MFIRSLLGAAVLTLSAAAAMAAPVVLDAFNDAQLIIGPGTTGQPANTSFMGLTAPSSPLIRTITSDFGAPVDFIAVDGSANTLTFASPIASPGGLSGSVVYTSLSPFSLDSLGDKLTFKIEDVSLDALFGPVVLTFTVSDGTNSDSIVVLDSFGIMGPAQVIPASGSTVEILNGYWSGVNTAAVTEMRFDIFSEPYGSITLGEMVMTGSDPGDDLFVILDPPAAIPLPAGVWLLGAGLGALALRRRRAAA